MSGAFPGVEFNYGIIANGQFHIIAPLAFDSTAGQLIPSLASNTGLSRRTRNELAPRSASSRSLNCRPETRLAACGPGRPESVSSDLASEERRRLDDLWRQWLLDQPRRGYRRQGLLVFRLAPAKEGDRQAGHRGRTFSSNGNRRWRQGQHRIQYRRDLRLQRAQSPVVIGRARVAKRIRHQFVFLVYRVSDHLLGLSPWATATFRLCDRAVFLACRRAPQTSTHARGTWCAADGTTSRILEGWAAASGVIEPLN